MFIKYMCDDVCDVLRLNVVRHAVPSELIDQKPQEHINQIWIRFDDCFSLLVKEIKEFDSEPGVKFLSKGFNESNKNRTTTSDNSGSTSGTNTTNQ